MAKETVLNQILDFMEQYPNSFIPRLEIEERLGINHSTCWNFFRRAYLYGLVEKSGTPHYQKYRLLETNREKWKLIYKQPTKKWRKKALSKESS